MLSYALQIILAATAFKTLLFDAYRSTDFEVHRNWLAVTYNVNISEWYNEATSKWTLDYPPFFGYFEWMLAQLGFRVDPHMLVLSAKPYVSSSTIYFQRTTVLISEFLFLYSICRLLSLILGSVGSKARDSYLVASFLYAFNFGLLVVDHIHFQYNGFLFGILYLSILKAFEGYFISSALWFAALLNFKHIFIYAAPVYLVFMLLHYCVKWGNLTPHVSVVVEEYRMRFQIGRLFALAITVCSVFAVSLTPFIYWNKLLDMLLRLFPFHRGLCHSYWAPNFWALYNALDKVLSVSGLCLRQSVKDSGNRVSMTSGLTGEYEYFCLPTVRPLHTAFMTAAFILPSLIFCKSYRKNLTPVDSGFILIRSLVAAAWGSFSFGWHVHEKAILMVTLPLIFLAVVSSKFRAFAFYVNTVAHFSLLPLIFTPNEQPVVLTSYLLYTLTEYLLLGRYSTPVSSGLLHDLWPYLTCLARVHLLGLIPLLLINRLLPHLYPHLEFLPLMLTSVYCAMGLLVAFLVYLWINFEWFFWERRTCARDEDEEIFCQSVPFFLKKNN